MVNVVVFEPELNVTLPPNSCAKFPKVIVWDPAELNVMGAAKLHGPEVLLFDHEPPTVHVPAPDVM
jgi:hypothetical protein